MGKSEGMRHLGISTHRWKGYIKMDLKETGWVVTGWIYPAQGRETRRALVKLVISVTAGFHSEVDENCALLRYYTASGGNSLSTFRDNISVPSADRFSRNVGNKLPPLAAC